MLGRKAKWPFERAELRRLPERRLTICIAASAEHGKYLVCAADTMIASALATSDPFASKIHLVAEWGIMLSGTLGLADSFVDSLTREMMGAKDNEPKTILGFLQAVHRRELSEWNAGQWLAPYGLDMGAFLGRGQTLPPSVESDLARKISLSTDDWDVEVIVCGWGETIKALAREGKSAPIPYIFSADCRGIKLHKTAGLYACGSGSPAALSTLYFHDYGAGFSLPKAVYCVATAKFMAERTIGVGPNTVMLVMQRTGGVLPITPEEVERMRTLWLEKGAPRIPNEASKIVADFLHNKQELNIR